MEGDWVTLLLFVFFFFILPILQQVFQKKRPPPPPTQLPEAEEDWEPLPQGRREASSRVPAPEQWEEWPEEDEVEAIAARERSAWEELGLEMESIFREPRPEPRAPEPVTASPAPIPSRSLPTTPPPEWLPPASPPPPQVVSMEPLVVDRKAEHDRFHDRYVVPSRPPARRIPNAPLAAQIHDPKELRRAIILNEVLGLPRALRPPEA